MCAMQIGVQLADNLRRPKCSMKAHLVMKKLVPMCTLLTRYV